jgi:hypothetical protein
MEHVIWRRGEPAERSACVKGTDVVESDAVVEVSPVVLALEEPVYSKDREKMNDKLNDRYLIKQMAQNPFLTGSYIDDLNIQEQFLRPKSSHTEN